MAAGADDEVLVVGAGVTGLTTALTVADAGIPVRVMTAKPPELTHSAMAGASWGPYMTSHEKILRWSTESLRVFGKLAESAETGVRLTEGLEVSDQAIDLPSWALKVPDCRECSPAELPDGYLTGWRYTIPLIDMPVYLRHLSGQLAKLGVDVEIVPPFGSLDDLLTLDAATVVNCTGVGARDLVPDDDVRPSRGQLVVVENPGVTSFFQDNVNGPDITCIFPHGTRVVLGGIAAPGSDSPTPDPAVTKRIVERCAAIEPQLAGAAIVGHRVGLRPQRPEPRVERDPRNPHRLIHNYGHGGSGVTLSWGCAYEVLELLRAYG